MVLLMMLSGVRGKESATILEILIIQTSLDCKSQGSRGRGRPSNTRRRKVAAKVADLNFDTRNAIKPLAVIKLD